MELFISLISRNVTHAGSHKFHNQYLYQSIPYQYQAFTQTANKRVATCKECGIGINDAGSTTSNFIRHLKMHARIGQSLG